MWVKRYRTHLMVVPPIVVVVGVLVQTFSCKENVFFQQSFEFQFTCTCLDLHLNSKDGQITKLIFF